MYYVTDMHNKFNTYCVHNYSIRLSHDMTILLISEKALPYNTSSKLGIQHNHMYEMYFITKSNI